MLISRTVYDIRALKDGLDPTRFKKIGAFLYKKEIPELRLEEKRYLIEDPLSRITTFINVFSNLLPHNTS
ncbi:MAG: hypothetical protein NTZ20_04040 [Candidatus Levybacteria bacterium]|nr:hypothetical protein [Candidatus Levybacteria bacterium]